jgi:membrane protein YdbS with pleckstrin-like domain
VSTVPLPRKFLNEDEELLAELRPHWVYFFGPLLTSIVVWAAVGSLVIGVPSLPNWTSYPLLILAAIPTLWLLGRLLRWRSYTLALTTTRIVVRQGVFNRDTIQLRLQRITEINLSQELWERALGTGRLIIDVQGEDDAVVLEYVRKPAIVQRVINSQINELVGGGAREPMPEEMRPYVPKFADPRHDEHRSEDTPPFGTSAVTSEPDTEPAHDPEPAATASTTPSTGAAGSSHFQIRDRLIELDDLRQRGILSEAEFAAKKAELLNRI